MHHKDIKNKVITQLKKNFPTGKLKQNQRNFHFLLAFYRKVAIKDDNID